VVDLDQLLFEGLKRLLIQMKLERERAVGYTRARWSMAIAWSRISSKVIAHPP
jgi:hypothetical protein